MKRFRYTDASANSVGWKSDDGKTDTNGTKIEDTFYFKTTEDMRQGMQSLLRNPNAEAGDLESEKNHITSTGTGPTVGVDSSGKFTVSNPDTDANIQYDLSISVDSLRDAKTTENIKFTQTMQALSGSLPTGSSGVRQSQSLNVPVHSSSIDIFDSLGTKHTVKIDFRKESFDPTTGSTWKTMITVPEPGIINIAGGTTGVPKNIIEGQVSFNSDGSLSTFTPPSITFTGNNGSAANQTINLAVGTANAFDGITSFDSKSTTSGISQDGYTGGDLVGIRIDQSGTLVGSFSNGRSFGLAQISMAKFANNEGLATQGGNLYTQSANSGNPIIGTAASGGRGFIQASSLEGSNVDLSQSLTQLIVIQRGYQANGKTITTSDQLLQTLIGLKQ
jgi:flagellar hook protein FlgE